VTVLATLTVTVPLTMPLTKTRTLCLSGCLAASLLLSACGFSLRGSAELSAKLQPLHIESVVEGSAMERELQRVLTNNHVALATDANSDGYSLGIGQESSSERALSVNANARAGEYEIEMTLPFQLRHGSTVVLPPETLSLSKVYLADPDNAIAKNEEGELIRTEMRREMARQILRRLQTVPISP
jgi:LPS-assembly lipoprotein